MFLLRLLLSFSGIQISVCSLWCHRFIIYSLYTSSNVELFESKVL
uniref:Uncharacterized protein n=1 Tax=Anguilla anguilla TaxID=7936 RepID=A0A0E9TFZ3_ANGAN